MCHENRIVYRDTKTHNYCVGGTEKTAGIVYLIDFGSAKFYEDENGVHIPYREGLKLSGTAKFACVNTHIGIEQSRRNDLGAIGHCFVFLFNGDLPWSGQKKENNGKDKYEHIRKKMLSVPTEELCKGMPWEFKAYMDYARGLEFSAKPDYDYLLNLFYGCMERHGIDKKNPPLLWTKKDLPLSLEKDDPK